MLGEDKSFEANVLVSKVELVCFKTQGTSTLATVYRHVADIDNFVIL